MRAAFDRGLRGYLIRTSWLFGEDGGNFVETMLRLMLARREVRVVADQWGRPTYARDLADAAWRLVTRSAPPGLYHFANAGPVTWHGFATGILELAREAELPVTVTAVTPSFAKELPRPAPRPAYSVLSTERYARVVGAGPRSWVPPLREYLASVRSELG